ncbi:MAG TPA: transcriptional regulator [Acetobacteraceae bacterium]|jgi:LysR family transcriptional regulator, glycine cleavage system transcriptional activator|nr:transcriptional regulator [Acetobacteraceae bacterium]
MSRPSLRALKAFAETVRSGTLAGASGALNVTPSAVSHLLRELEQALNLPLFISKARPTETGERLGRRLIAAFDAIDGAIAEARYQAGDVRISALSSYLTLWLVPRLTGFQRKYPDTRLLFSTTTRPVDLTTEPFECAIRWGRGPWPDLECTLLFTDCPVVVTNPRLVGTQPLPRLAARVRPDDWTLVAAALGWADTPPALTFETRALAVQAATAGMGAAVVDRNLVSDMIEAGILAEIAPDPPVPVAEGYWFVALPDRLRNRQIRQFRDWLAEESGR